ncbi:MAG: hypothetical protein GKS01_10620 [Alphaproteobacteria bacterium]|nr:hypothetical protein [Alphaproteobacteria bacterium]
METESKHLSVISWDEDDTPEGGSALTWWGGFFENGMRWKDYVGEFDAKTQRYMEVARHSAIENKVKVSGGVHQSGGITPVFSDGAYFLMSLRSWGDFMAAVWSEEENKNYSYLDFYG